MVDDTGSPAASETAVLASSSRLAGANELSLASPDRLVPLRACLACWPATYA